MNSENILIVDDEPISCENLCLALEKDGYKCSSAASAEEALERFHVGEFALILTDLMLPGMDGIELMHRVRQNSPSTAVIVITGHATVSSAVTAMQKGAYCYISKPINIEELKVQVSGALEKRALSAEVIRLRQEKNRDRKKLPLIGHSKKLSALRRDIPRLAQMNCNILIEGETGTGKELVAQSIHKLSPRAEKRFMAINCGAFTPELMDNELFGHEKEAFTGASRGRRGILEDADGGTVFFDEISELPLNLQVKLLRVLQERRFLRVGGTREIPVDIRIIAATNCDLSQEVAEGRFRQDLYYRLNVVNLMMPPLRELSEDIPLLVAHFLEKYKTPGSQLNAVSQKTLEALMQYNFPGNVRELENIVQRAVALANSEVFTPDLLPMETAPLSTEKRLKSLEEMEKDYIQQIMQETGGNKTRAAEILRIDRVSLWRKLKKYKFQL